MSYQDDIKHQVTEWKTKMTKPPSFTNDLSRKLQARINRAIPQKIHNAITAAIKQMTRAFLFGSELTSAQPWKDIELEVREAQVSERIKFYRNTAAAEGAVTGAAGIILGLADFPIWLALKMKMLTEIAALYGKDVSKLSERVFILHIFEMTFSSQKRRAEVFKMIEYWNEHEKNIPADINKFDWLRFQQEYRDYIDIAKLLQLVPGIGAAVGAVVNHRLTNKLGLMAMNAYRVRLLQENETSP
jgi:uncharacterized protein (DUF697 family)